MTREIQSFQKLKPELSDRVLTINLILSEDHSVAVRSCEVVGNQFRNRTSFTTRSELEDVFNERIAIAIRHCLARVPEGAHVMSLPDFLVELPGLALAGVHIMIMEVKDGLRNAILRFKDFIGSVNEMFKPVLGVEQPSANYSERLAVNVLGDICLPLLNLAREIETAHRLHDAAVSVALIERCREFEFQTELLKRFVFNSGRQAQKTKCLGTDADDGVGLLF